MSSMPVQVSSLLSPFPALVPFAEAPSQLPIELLRKKVGGVFLTFIRSADGGVQATREGLQASVSSSHPVSISGIPVTWSKLNREQLTTALKNSHLILKGDTVELQAEPKAAQLEPKIAQAKKVLKPLNENPFHRESPQGFRVTINEAHQYYRQYPEWCKNVEDGFASIRQAHSYVERIKKCSAALEISADEAGFSDSEKQSLKKVDQAIGTILGEAGKEKLELASIAGAIISIHEATYQLIALPIKEVLNYLKDPRYIFIQNQTHFRKELRKVLPDPEQRILQLLLDKMIDAIQADQVENTKDVLIKEYPNCQEIVRMLATKAQALLEQERGKAQAEIQKFQCLPSVAICLPRIFFKCPSLRINYLQMFQGFYSSIGEISRNKEKDIVPASYLPKLATLLAYCEEFEASPSITADVVNKLQVGCSEFLVQKKAIDHLQDVVEPLVFLKQCVENLLLWPQQYEFAEQEIEYINRNLSLFIAISGTQMTSKPFVPYAYQAIAPEQAKNAAVILKKKDTTDEKKREALRILFHARIPWKELQAIGCLLHSSGGVSSSVVEANKQLVKASLLDVYQNLPTVLASIEELIAFEEGIFSVAPSFISPKTLSEACYEFIQLLGNNHEMHRSLKKIQECLANWNNLPFTAADYKNGKTKYAALRTIQILGEMSKNLQGTGMWEAGPIWDYLEELRDILSHTERVSINKRLQQLLEDPEGYVGLFSSIHADFQRLEEYIREQTSVLKRSNTWEERKSLHQTRKESKTSLELKGIEDLYIFLSTKISVERQVILRQTLTLPEACAVRDKTLLIQKTFKEGKFNGAIYKQQIVMLPLTKTQQGSLQEAIKNSISPAAAKNNMHSAKPKILGKLHNSLKEFKNVLNTPAALAQLKTIEELLPPRDYFKTADKDESSSSASSSDEADFRAKIVQIGVLFEKIKKECAHKNIQLPQLKGVQLFLTQLVESLEDFIQRNKEEGQELVDAIQIYEGESEVENAGNELIRLIALSKLSVEGFKQKLNQLGLTYEGIWKQTHDTCMKLNEYASADKNENEGVLLAIQKKKAAGLIDAISGKIAQLDKLLLSKSHSEAFKTFQQDPLLQLACQYLVSGFRKIASSLDLHIESIRHAFPQFEGFKSIQQTLEASIKIGNDILHVHEVSEPGTLTEYGQVLNAFQQLSNLLINFNVGRDHNISIDSLDKKLRDLKQFLSGL